MTNRFKNLSIETQAAIALMLIQLAHKLVAEIQSTITMVGVFNHWKVYAVLLLAGLYVVAIILCLWQKKPGFIIGMVLGIEIVLQPLIFHVLAGIPKDPQYYILFPILQGILVFYFCRLGYKKVKEE